MAKSKKQRTEKRFEPITRQQNRKLHALARQKHFSEQHLYKVIEELIGLPSITALSKQEASLIIQKMEGARSMLRYRPRHPAYPPPAGYADLPNLSYIRGIRHIARDLGWDKEHLKNWLKKYLKTSSIRDLDPDTARKAFIGLRRVHAYRKKLRQVGAGRDVKHFRSRLEKNRKPLEKAWRPGLD
jgi:hypothetical protein